MIAVIRSACGLVSVAYIAGVLCMLVGCANTPASQVYALKSGLQVTEDALAVTLRSGAVDPAVKAAIKADVTAAHDAVDAAEQAVQAGGSDTDAALAAAQAAVDKAASDKGV